MKTILIVLFTAVGICACAQDTTVTQIEYFFDSDNGAGNDSLVNVAPVADGTFSFTASIAGLEVGYHKLYIRTKDSNGKWSFTARRNVEVFAPDTKTTIVSGEYFIDTDSGFNAGRPITVTTPNSAILQNFTAATSGLSIGYHKLYGRFKDNLGRWSQTFRRNMEIYKNDTNYVTKAEYFFRTDNGYGNCTDVTLANTSVADSFIFYIPRTTIPAGADTLFVRVQDSNENKWSLTQWVDSILTILPLTLVDFTVTKQNNNSALLNWQTTNEINTSYFNIQRSTDGSNFKTVGKVNAKASAGAINNYVYQDDITQMQAGKAYYRLQMTDIDARFTYSNVRYISIDKNGVNIVLFPNPAHNYFIVRNNNVNLSNAMLTVKDVTGRLFITRHLNNDPEQNINISPLAKGVYIINIYSSGYNHSEELIVQ